MKALAPLTLLVLGCATLPPPEPPPPASAPQATGPSPAAPAKGPKPPEPAAVPAPPAECQEFNAQATCADATGTTGDRLARALELTDAVARDRELRCIESSWQEAKVLIRILRADIGPAQCADVIVTPLLEAPPAKLEQVDESALVGLLISGRLARLVGSAPELAPPFDKARFLDFFEGELRPWMIGQALAIGELSNQAAKLTGYGKAIAALAAGEADLRFVRAARAVPLPTELAADPEVKNTYEAALDEALEPRKTRGRDAALVGLRILSELGAVRDARIQAAQRLLSETYGGGRVDALSGLLLPELPPLAPKSLTERLAASLPTFYAGRLLGTAAGLRSPGVLRALAEHGVPANIGAGLDARALEPDAKLYYATAEMQRGITYFASPAFEHARAILGDDPRRDSERLLAALASALLSAPRDAAELMLSGPRLKGPLGSFEALEALAARGGALAGLAEYDAAYLRWLTPSENDPAFWRDLEKRFQRAEKKLQSPAHKSAARAQAEAARETARAVTPK